MRRSSPAYALVVTVARDLSAALEGGTLPREDRREARGLLLQAYLVRPAGRDRTPPEVADRLARRMDALLAGARTSPAVPAPPRLPRTVRVRAGAPMPLDARIRDLEERVRWLARRTDRMVEHALAAAGEGTRPPPGPAGTKGAPPREVFELVWGETEGR